MQYDKLAIFLGGLIDFTVKIVEKYVDLYRLLIIKGDEMLFKVLIARDVQYGWAATFA